MLILLGPVTLYLFCLSVSRPAYRHDSINHLRAGMMLMTSVGGMSSGCHVKPFAGFCGGISTIVSLTGVTFGASFLWTYVVVGLSPCAVAIGFYASRFRQRKMEKRILETIHSLPPLVTPISATNEKRTFGYDTTVVSLEGVPVNALDIIRSEEVKTPRVFRDAYEVERMCRFIRRNPKDKDAITLMLAIFERGYHGFPRDSWLLMQSFLYKKQFLKDDPMRHIHFKNELHALQGLIANMPWDVRFLLFFVERKQTQERHAETMSETSEWDVLKAVEINSMQENARKMHIESTSRET